MTAETKEDVKKPTRQTKPKPQTDGEKIAEANKEAGRFVLTEKGWEFK